MLYEEKSKGVDNLTAFTGIYVRKGFSYLLKEKGITLESVKQFFGDDVATLYSLLSEYDLCLVDWCKATKVTADTEEVYQYFRDFLE